MNPTNEDAIPQVKGTVLVGAEAGNVGGIEDSLKLRIPLKLRVNNSLFAPIIAGIAKGQPSITTDVDKNMFKLKVAAATIAFKTGIICYVPYWSSKDSDQSDSNVSSEPKRKAALAPVTTEAVCVKQLDPFPPTTSLEATLPIKPPGESPDILGIPDGDWVYETGEVDCSVIPSIRTLIEEAFSLDFMSATLSVLIVTKVCFWKNNHHTGASNVYSYLRNVFVSRFKDSLGDFENYVTTIDTIGHWVSTRKVLRLLNVQGIAPVEPVIVPTASITYTNDVAIRISSNPAGTDKLFLAFKVGEILCKSKYAKYCPNVEEFFVLKEAVNKVKEYPARYHIQGEYLCAHKGETFLKPEFCNSDFNKFLGRAGTYAKHMMKKASINNSPHFQNLSKYPDYSIIFDTMLSNLSILIELNLE